MCSGEAQKYYQIHSPDPSAYFSQKQDREEGGEEEDPVDVSKAVGEAGKGLVKSVLFSKADELSLIFLQAQNRNHEIPCKHSYFVFDNIQQANLTQQSDNFEETWWSVSMFVLASAAQERGSRNIVCRQC